MRDHISLAFRNLRRRGLRSWLTLLGILIGVAAVVSLLALGNGLREAVISQFGISTTEVISVQAGGLSNVGPPGTGVTNPLTRQDVDAIAKLSGVEESIARNIRTVKVEFNKKSVFTAATTIPEDRDQYQLVYEIADLEAMSGHLLSPDDSGQIVIGHDFSIKEKSGFDKTVKLGDSLVIQGKRFTVRGILQKKGSFIFDKIILVNDEELKDLLDYGDEVDLIAVKVKDKDQIDRISEDIEELMRKRRDVKKGSEDFQVSTPQATLETIDSVLRGIQIFIVMIALVSIIVGAIGIVNTMTTSVLERRKEIGIMKAIGARNLDIFYQFLFEAGLLGLFGGIIGVILGLIVGGLGIAGINSFIGSNVGLSFNIWWILVALLASFLIGAVSGIAPALRAANQRPVEALRG